MNRPVWVTKRVSERRYASRSAIGRVATPDSAAARATAGAIRRISRRSKGLGVR
jgi:hypothetical protein